MGELLPCPVCRAKAEQHEETRRVRCSNADCMMRLGDARFTVEVWNRRASADVSEAEVERALDSYHAKDVPGGFWPSIHTLRQFMQDRMRAALTAARGERP